MAKQQQQATKYMVQVQGRKLILNDEQVQYLAKLWAESEYLSEDYVGSNKGYNGGHYNYSLKTTPMFPPQMMGVEIMPQSFYDAMVTLAACNEQP